MARADYVAAQMWSYLVTTFQNEAVPSGRLSTVKDVRKSIQLWKGSEYMPAIGVQLIDIRQEAQFTKMGHAYVQFQIVAACQSADAGGGISGTSIVPANLDDAMAQVQTIVSDGNGNGIVDVLNDGVNFSVGGNAFRSQVKRIQYDWEIRPGEPPEVFAYALITFEAEQLVSVATT